MRILALNPNTNAEITELVMRVLAPMTPDDVALVPAAVPSIGLSAGLARLLGER